MVYVPSVKNTRSLNTFVNTQPSFGILQAERMLTSKRQNRHNTFFCGRTCRSKSRNEKIPVDGAEIRTIRVRAEGTGERADARCRRWLSALAIGVGCPRRVPAWVACVGCADGDCRRWLPMFVAVVSWCSRSSCHIYCAELHPSSSTVLFMVFSRIITSDTTLTLTLLLSPYLAFNTNSKTHHTA